MTPRLVRRDGGCPRRSSSGHRNTWHVPTYNSTCAPAKCCTHARRTRGRRSPSSRATSPPYSANWQGNATRGLSDARVDDSAAVDQARGGSRHRGGEWGSRSRESIGRHSPAARGAWLAAGSRPRRRARPCVSERLISCCCRKRWTVVPVSAFGCDELLLREPGRGRHGYPR